MRDQDSEDTITETGLLETPADLGDIQEMLKEAVASEPALRLLPNFSMGPAGNPDFHRICFAVHCTCGTAGLISVEAAKSKTLSQIKDALPTLKQHLLSRAKQFASMPCSMHKSMRAGGIQASTPGRGES